MVLLLRTVTHQTNSEAVKHLRKARIYSIIDERVYHVHTAKILCDIVYESNATIA